MLYVWVAAFVFASVAMVIDIKWLKTPNWLVLVILAAGIGYHAYTHTLATAWQGFLLGFSTILLYFLGVLGAGDVKMLAALGSLIGPVIVAVLFTSYLSFAVFSVLFLLFRGNLRDNLKREWRVIYLYGASLLNLVGGLRFARVKELLQEIGSCQAGFQTLPFNVFIWLGVVAAGTLALRG